MDCEDGKDVNFLEHKFLTQGRLLDIEDMAIMRDQLKNVKVSGFIGIDGNWKLSNELKTHCP